MEQKKDNTEGVEFVKAHSRETALIAVTIILAVISPAFMEILKLLLSPQVIIGLIVVYLVRLYRREIADLFPRVKEIKPIGLAFSVEDVKHLPKPKEEVSGTEPVTVEACSDDLKKSEDKARYWFFRYTCSYMSRRTRTILRALGTGIETTVDDLHYFLTENYPESKYSLDNLQESLSILSEFGFITRRDDKVRSTDLGREIIEFEARDLSMFNRDRTVLVPPEYR